MLVRMFDEIGCKNDSGCFLKSWSDPEAINTLKRRVGGLETI
jgi:hypothetical protein